MTKRCFAELKEQTALIPPIRSRLWDIYQCKTLPEHRVAQDWGMSLVLHFKGRVSVDEWLGLRCQIELAVRTLPELAGLVKFIPYYEIGQDFIVRCKPPYDGGFSMAQLEESVDHGDGGAPPDGCEASYGKLVKCVSQVRATLPAEIATVLDATFSGKNMDLFFAEDGWLVFEISLPDEEDCSRVSGT